jgi:hypothetical protein
MLLGIINQHTEEPAMSLSAYYVEKVIAALVANGIALEDATSMIEREAALVAWCAGRGDSPEVCAYFIGDDE